MSNRTGNKKNMIIPRTVKFEKKRSVIVITPHLYEIRLQVDDLMINCQYSMNSPITGKREIVIGLLDFPNVM